MVSLVTDQPLVSIIIPVYNGSNYMREAIDSALAQTWKNVEVLVVNDGSNDFGKSREVALSFGNRIRYFEKENGGVSTALNLGIKEMKGEYVSWLSHDDVYYPEKVAIQVDELLRIGQDVILYGDFDIIDLNSRKIGSFVSGSVSPREFRRLLVGRGPVHGCTTLIPCRCFERVGLFDETLRTSQDYDFWFRLSRDYDFVHMPKLLIRSRSHAEQGSHTMNDTRILEGNRLFKKILKELINEETDKFSGEFNAYLRDVALHLCQSGYNESALYAVKQHDMCCRNILMRSRLHLEVVYNLGVPTVRRNLNMLLAKIRL